MTVRHTPGRRDLYKAATAVLTGLAALGSLAGTGYAAGAIARQQELGDQDEQQSPPASTVAAPAPVPAVAKRRPHRTVVRTEVVHRVSTNAASVGTGGTISTGATGGSGSGSGSASSASSSSGGGGHVVPRPPAQAPAPAPAPRPAPAPSSGS